jgi:4-amino-4-deoxy-L-arabinose transferase-like glycosyltransferase
MLTSKKEKLIFTLLVTVLLLLYIIGLFFNVTGDAAKYAYISKEILQTNEWFNIQIQGETYIQKPQFIFWLSSLSFKIFGFSNLSFKLPIFLYSLGGIWGTFQLASSLYGKKTGLLSATMLAFSSIYLLYNSDIHTDIVLLTNVVISLWLLYEFIRNQKYLYLIGAAFATGLAVLTKGPFGAIIPFVSVAGFLIASKQYKLLYSPKWILFIVLVVLISSPLFYPLFKQEGLYGSLLFLWRNNVGRATGSYMGTNTDLFYYIHNLSYLLLPWTVFFAAGLYFQFKKLLQKQFKNSDHFLFWGSSIVFIILSFSHSKLPNYIFSLIPVLIITSALGWQAIFQSNANKWLSVQKWLTHVLWIIVLFIPLYLKGKNSILSICVLLALFVIQTISSFNLNKKSKIFFQTLFLMLAIGIVLNIHLLPILTNIQAQEKAARFLNMNTSIDEKIYNYNVVNIERKEEALSKRKDERISSFDKTPNENHFYYNFELMFYCNNYIENINEREQLNVVLSKKNKYWFFADKRGMNELVDLKHNIDTIIPFQHFNIRRPARSIDYKKGELNYEEKYLILIDLLNEN